MITPGVPAGAKFSVCGGNCGCETGLKGCCGETFLRDTVAVFILEGGSGWGVPAPAPLPPSPLLPNGEVLGGQAGGSSGGRDGESVTL